MVEEGGDGLKGSDLVILAGLGAGRGAAALALADTKTAPPTGAEALTVSLGSRYEGKPAVILAGSDATGLMYAALDQADRVTWSKGAADLLEYARDASEKPFLKERGVAVFTMNRAYFESRLHDEKFWTRYLDTLGGGPFQLSRADIRLRRWRLHDAAVPVFLQCGRIP